MPTINNRFENLTLERLQEIYDIVSIPVSTGLTVGVTTITGGTVGRVLFEGTGNVLQESANLFWDNTNNRLGIGTATPTAKNQIVGAGTTNTTFPFLATDSAGTLLFRISDLGHITLASNQASKQARFFLSGYTTYPALNITSGSTTIATVDGGNLIMQGGLIQFYNGTSTTEWGRFFSTGNLLLQTGGTYTDAGLKLDVNGTARVKGTGTTFATTTFSVQNSLGNNMLRVRDDARVFVGVSTSPFFGAMNRVTTGGEVTGEGFIFNCNGNSTGTDYLFGGSNINASSGTITTFLAQRNFIPSSGSAVHNVVRISSVINQTGGANGITRGLLINPTLTAAADYRAIEVESGITILGASTTAKASLRIPSGTAPTSPVNGDIWFDGTDIKMQIGGVTKTFTLV